MLHIDDRLAKLAEAATRSARRPDVIRRPHDRRLAVASDPHQALGEDRALELTGALLEGFAAGDTALLRTICAESIHARTPMTETTDLDGLTESVRIDQPAFADIEIDIETLALVDLLIAAEWRLHATHTGPLTVDWAEVEATGQRITLVGALVAHLVVDDAAKGATIAFDDVHLHYDTTHLLVQLALT